MTAQDVLSLEERGAVIEIEGEPAGTIVNPASDHEAAVENSVWEADMAMVERGIVSYDQAVKHIRQWREHRFVGDAAVSTSLIS